jgi:hypothetical protein
VHTFVLPPAIIGSFRNMLNILPFTRWLLKGSAPCDTPERPVHGGEDKKEATGQASQAELDARIEKWVSSSSLRPPQ